MASHRIREQVSHQVSGTLASVSASGWLGGGCLLPEAKVREAMEAEGVSCRQCLFTPLVVLWTFLGQVMGPDRSCRAAVARLLAWLAARRPPEAQGAQGAQGAEGAQGAQGAAGDEAWGEMD